MFKSIVCAVWLVVVVILITPILTPAVEGAGEETFPISIGDWVDTPDGRGRVLGLDSFYVIALDCGRVRAYSGWAVRESVPVFPAMSFPSLNCVSYGSYIHTVKEGETIWGISEHYGIPMNELLRVNPIVWPDINFLPIGVGLVITPATTP